MKAFPNGIITNDKGLIVGGQQGMDLRDWFAGLAMQAIIGRPDYVNSSAEAIAVDAYGIADEMLNERQT